MTATTKERRAARTPRGPVRRFGPSSVLVLAVAFAAAAVLLVSTPDDDPGPPPPPARVASTAAWPDARRATITGKLSDGATFVPGHFLDARTAVGTAPSPDGRSLRLVVRRVDGSPRVLRSLPLERDATFGSFAASGTELVWVESTNSAAPEIWVASLRDARSPARLLTADTGAALFVGSQYDLLINGGRVYWAAAAAAAGADATEIRSVPVSGGAVSVRTEKGRWGLSAWPWLTDGSDQTSRARLRDPQAGRDVEVDTGSGTELVTCSPAWCRVTVVREGGIARIDLMHHDGSARRTVADGAASAVGADVAVLDRFELLFESLPGADRQVTSKLLVHDIAAARTVEVSPAVDGAFSRAGLLWWSTSEGDTVVWHTLDLRTV